MRNRRLWAICLAAALCLGGAAQAEAFFTGTVAARETVSVVADVGGTVESLSVRAGERVEAGQTVATVSATGVYAVADGTVRGLTAQQGDSAEQTVLSIAPVSRYTVSATLDDAYDTAANKYITLGESVYMRCSADGTHRAIGRVVGIEGSNYTVEVTGGELYMEETVYIYREDSYESSSRIGSGTVSRSQEIAVSGTGLVASICVGEGESVERGQLLFTCVDADSAESAARGGSVISTASGVVTSVAARVGQALGRGASVICVCPDGAMCVELEVEEADLGYIQVGDRVDIYFDWDEDGANAAVGTVTAISALGTQGEDGVIYTAYVDFEATDAVRLGMTVSATVTGNDLSGGAQHEAEN